jgi:hypothetical protein
MTSPSEAGQERIDTGNSGDIGNAMIDEQQAGVHSVFLWKQKE